MTKTYISGFARPSICVVGAMALALSGCGGGDSTSSPATPPTTPASPPSFTSATTATILENTGTPFYTATANDPRGGTVNYSINGGIDAAAFTISGNQLRFTVPPNFDLPSDADRDNVYKVQLLASNGQSASTLDLQVTVTNDKEGIAVHRIASGFVDPVAIVPIPGDTKLFVAERGGKIYTLDPATGERTLFQEVFSSSPQGERGLKAIALGPDYISSGRYFILSGMEFGEVYINDCTRRGTFGGPECFRGVAAEAHGQLNNYGAFAGYGPDGKAYFVTGDAGGQRDPTGSAQNEGSILGKLLRIDNNPDPYAGASPQYYIATKLSKGFRNPRGGTFFKGMLLVGDRGESEKEEINLVSLTSAGNYGWPFKEGSTILSAPPMATTDPVIEYPHVQGGGVVGGYVYRGKVSSLGSQYIFADQSGVIYSVPSSQISQGKTLGPDALERRTLDFAPDAGTLGSPVAFGEDLNGELYILNANGDIFRVDN